MGDINKVKTIGGKEIADKPIIYKTGDIDVLEQYLESNLVSSHGIVSTSIKIMLEATIEVGFTAALYFVTPSEILEGSDYSQFPENIHFKGDSTDNGTFVPEENMRYTIVFDFDGYMVNGYVSGVSMG